MEPCWSRLRFPIAMEGISHIGALHVLTKWRSLAMALCVVSCFVARITTPACAGRCATKRLYFNVVRCLRLLSPAVGGTVRTISRRQLLYRNGSGPQWVAVSAASRSRGFSTKAKTESSSNGDVVSAQFSTTACH